MASDYNWRRIALCGNARVGKDTAIEPLLQLGYQHHAFGNLIKADLDELVQRRMGFSAFTTDTELKAKIRRSLEYVGDDMYDSYLDEYMATLPDRCINPRIMRLKEARLWRELGHPILEITRPNTEPCSEFERICMDELYRAGVITHTIANDSTPEDLQVKVMDLIMDADTEEGVELVFGSSSNLESQNIASIVYRENAWKGY